MFKVLLISWVIITVLLVWFLLWYLVTWFKSVFAKQNTLKTIGEEQYAYNEDQEDATSQEEFIEAEEAQDEPQDESTQEDAQEAVYEYVEETIILVEDGNEEDMTETADEINQELEEIVAESEEIADPSAGGEQETDEAAPAEPQQSSQAAPAPQKQFSTPATATYAAANVHIPETPKDYDASRNIAQWHSRDDIVRDKFDKHLQKIRYEASILQQRNDMLWYEKKLVEWLTLLPNDKEFQKLLADLYFHQWKYKKSLSLLKKILIENPEDHYALWQVGEIALTEWHAEDAFVHFQQAYAYCEDNPKYCFSLAQRYYDAWDLEQALALMEKMVKLRPKSIEYLVSLSHVQHKMGLRENAKQSLLRALELDPMNITIKQYLKSL
jgi:tetratricopeptide (TPR) repeat protein